MNLDFSDARRRKRFLAAKKLITDGYRIMRDEVGADNPADNAFIREATICAAEGLVWVGDRGGTDARSATGEEVEIKSTRLDGRASINFPTSRYVSPTVIARFRAADWWAFGVFDLYEELVALYRVEQADMKPRIDALEQRMLNLSAAGRAYQNNPKFPFSLIRRSPRFSTSTPRTTPSSTSAQRGPSNVAERRGVAASSLRASQAARKLSRMRSTVARVPALAWRPKAMLN